MQAYRKEKEKKSEEKCQTELNLILLSAMEAERSPDTKCNTKLC